MVQHFISLSFNILPFLCSTFYQVIVQPTQVSSSIAGPNVEIRFTSITYSGKTLAICFDEILNQMFNSLLFNILPFLCSIFYQFIVQLEHQMFEQESSHPLIVATFLTPCFDETLNQIFKSLLFNILSFLCSTFYKVIVQPTQVSCSFGAPNVGTRFTSPSNSGNYFGPILWMKH